MRNVRTVAALALLALAAPPAPSQQPSPEPCGLPRAVTVEQAIPFTLERAYTDPSAAGAGTVSRGTVVVLRTDPELVAARAEAMPVLYADRGPLEVVCASTSGRAVAILPGDDGLAATPLWFGRPEHRRIDAAAARRAASEARAAGIAPLPRRQARAALRAGGSRIAARDRAALFQRLEPLVETVCWTPGDVSGNRP